MTIRELVQNRAVRIASASVAAVAVVSAGTAYCIADQQSWERTHAKVDAFECSQALQGKPVVNGGGGYYSNDHILTCKRADGSELKVLVTGYDSLVKAVHSDGLPDLMKLPG